jgi:tellurite resistance protein
MWVVVALSLVGLLVAHAIRGFASNESFLKQLEHPAQGPLAALIPIVGMLVGDHTATIWPVLGHVISFVSMALAFGFAAWLLSFWMRGHLQPAFVHGGYLLPTVAAGFIAAIVSARAGLIDLAFGAFSIGLFFWVIFFILVTVRLAMGPALPAALMPTQAILAAPPAIGGIAWLAITGEQPGLIFDGFLALTVLMVLVQALWLRRYFALPYTLGMWSFTFPAAAVALIAMHWVAIVRPAGGSLIVGVLLVLVSLIVLMNVVRSVALIAVHRRGIRLAERDLADADNAIGR